MSRQHTTPILLPADASTAVGLELIPLHLGPGAVSEASLQQIIHDHPACLPISEVDPLFANPVPVCMELNTPAGPIDNFLITPTGLPVLVECKLWRNPEGRREVVGQILDYAKELGRWSSSDLQRETARRLKGHGNVMLDLVRRAGHEVDEIEFNDALTHNLRRGRFLLLIVGDGIREGVEAIAEYLTGNAGLHFTLGLVELPIFRLPDGGRIVVPRLLTRTRLITRTVVAAPEGTLVVEDEANGRAVGEAPNDPATEDRIRILNKVVSGLILDDPEQPQPKVTPKGYMYVYLPAPSSSCWITVSIRPSVVGLSLSSTANSFGEQALRSIMASWDEVKQSLGGHVEMRLLKDGKPVFEEFRSFDPSEEDDTAYWLRMRLNDFVNVFRPLVRSAVEEAEAGQS